MCSAGASAAMSSGQRCTKRATIFCAGVVFADDLKLTQPRVPYEPAQKQLCNAGVEYEAEFQM